MSRVVGFQPTRAGSAWVAVLYFASFACDPPAASAPPSAHPATATSTSSSALATPVPPAATETVDSAADAAVDAPSEARLTVHIVPIGPVPDKTIEQTAAALRDHAPVNPVIVQRHGFPRRARSPRAGAYRATVLLDWLDTLAIPHDGKIMGLTEADIVTQKGKHPIWGILGIGSIDGRSSLISTYRMRRKWENGGAPEALVRERLWKIAIHELGHTLGLEHCPKIGCIMEDGHGTVKTVDRDTVLCDSCAARFAASLKKSASR